MGETKLDSIGWSIIRIDRHMRQLMDLLQMKAGADAVVVTHGWILGFINAHADGPLYQKDMEQKFNIPRSTMTGIVKALEDAGYIYRESVEHDARLKQIKITEKGKSFCEEIKARFNEIEEVAHQGISDEEIQEYFRISNKIDENISNMLKKERR